MDLNKLMQMAIEHSHKIAKEYSQDQQIKELINSNTLLIMAKTISRLVPPTQIESELQKSLDEIRDYYFQHADDDNETDAAEMDAIIEITSLAKSSIIQVLQVADDMEIE